MRMNPIMFERSPSDHGFLDAFRAVAFATALGAAAVGHAGILPTAGMDGVTAGFYTDAAGATREALLLNGIPIAFKYDDFWSYSAPGLTALQADGFLPAATYGTFNFSTGTGGLDLKIFTGSGNVSNTPTVGATTFTFENAAPTPNGNGTSTQASTTESWGAGVQSNGPVTVGQLLSYLQALNPLNSIPAFYVDWNQTGAGDSILASAQFAIVDPGNPGTLVHTWALDSINQAGDGTWDQGFAGQVYNYGEISFQGSLADCDEASEIWDPITGKGCAGVTDNGSTYDKLSHNKGSGSPDFIFFAPTMDLSLFNSDFLFVVRWNIGCVDGQTFPAGAPSDWQGNDKYTQGCLNNGFEEAFLTGLLATPPVRVAEPSSIALMGGIGLAALFFGRARKARAKTAA